MDYNTPLIDGQFLKRYKRFFADIKINGKTVIAHVPNTGSLMGLCDEPRPCRVQPNNSPTRKLKFTLEQIQLPQTWVGVNTHKANDLAWEAFTNKEIQHWAKFNDGTREVKINPQSRLDMRISNQNASRFIEVKSVTLAKDNCALFPDVVTTRGQKHLIELIKLKKTGAEAELLFVIQREDCISFCPALSIDPEYARLLVEAHKAGVIISAFSTKLTPGRIKINTTEKIKILFS